MRKDWDQWQECLWRRLLSRLARRFVSCEKAALLALRSIERELSLGDRIALRFHLKLCQYCAGSEPLVAVLRRALHMRDKDIQAEGLLSAHLSPDARKRIIKALRDTRKESED